ncbi:MAG: CPBP family intramembrane glutamic endopeptidase [Nitrospirota bacterium]
MNRNIKKALTFIGLTFLFNYLLVILYFAFGGKWVAPGSVIITTAYMFIPMVTAIGVQKFIYKEPLKEPLGLSFKCNLWFFVAWLLPLVIALSSFGISLLFSGVEFSPGMEGFFEKLKSTVTSERLEEIRKQTTNWSTHPIWLGLFQGMAAGVTINMIAALGQELGWRGLLQREMGYMGFWMSSTIIGVVWGLWHIPIILQRQNSQLNPLMGVLMMVIFTILISPIFSYIRERAKSVIAASVIHGTVNATIGLSVMLIKGGNELIAGVTGLAGFITLIIVNIGLLLYDRFLAKEPILNGKWSERYPNPS